VVEYFRPLYVVSPPVTPFVFFAPLPFKIAPKEAIPPTLRDTALEYTFQIHFVGIRDCLGRQQCSQLCV